MVIADFQIKDKISRPEFFQKPVLIAKIKFEIVLKIIFMKISNSDVLLDKEILI